jgi:hypothetical protein
MHNITKSLKDLRELLADYAPEILFVLIALTIPALIYQAWRVKNLKADPHLNGLKILENYQNQALIRISHPGNILALSKTLPQSKTLLIRFQSLKPKELKFSIQLLKQVAAKRGVAIIKIDELLFLVEGMSDNFIPIEDLSQVKVIDFEGLEVSH